MNDDFKFSFENKHIIIGASAPGISSPKGTSMSGYTDDNVILATALDDALNNPDVKLLPNILGILITILVISITGYLFIIESNINVDKVFDTRNTYLHIYGKEETRPNRKMGHITIVGCNDKLNRGKDRQELLDKAKGIKVDDIRSMQFSDLKEITKSSYFYPSLKI